MLCSSMNEQQPRRRNRSAKIWIELHAEYSAKFNLALKTNNILYYIYTTLECKSKQKVEVERDILHQELG